MDRHSTSSLNRCLRHGDKMVLNIRLESSHIDRKRFFCVISSSYDNRRSHGNSNINCRRNKTVYSILGIDCHGSESYSVGLASMMNRNTKICLDGDGGFSVFQPTGEHFIFKPVSVQALWTVIQTLHMISNTPAVLNSCCVENDEAQSQCNYVISSPQSCINEWRAMSDLLVKRPASPDRTVGSRDGEDIETQIKFKLREIMKTVDLDNITSKRIRNSLEMRLKMDLEDYKPFIDKEILVILGQMDTASKILDNLFLGSEWNASNLDELKANGITHILNVTREIDNFFPGVFEYRNIRVYDEEATDLLKYFDETYRFINKALGRKGKVLVHCKMGISRSATVTISYLMKEYEKNLADSIIFVKERRDVINPNKSFIKQLEVYEGILGAIRHRHNRLFRSKSESSLKSKEEGDKQRTSSTSYNGSNYNNNDDNGDDDENCRNINNNRINNSQRSTKKVKALAHAFNRPEFVSRPKSWSPNERVSSLLLDQEDEETLLHIDEECQCYNNIVTKILVSSPSSTATVNSYSENVNCKCNVELELEVPNEPVVLHGPSDYIVQNLSDVPIRLRQTINESDVRPHEDRRGSEESCRDYDKEELLSVKTIANMFDFKESSPSKFATLSDDDGSQRLKQ